MQASAPSHPPSAGSSLAGSPEKGAAADAHALRRQLEQMQREREELLVLLEASLEGLHLQGELQDECY